MRILIVGKGIVGTIYGWALKAAGHEVDHLVRPDAAGNEEDVVFMDVLDERKGFPRLSSFPHERHLIREPHGNYDLVLAPVHAFQLETALAELVPKVPGAFWVLLTQNWHGEMAGRRHLPRSRYLLAYPDAGGTLRGGAFWTDLGPELHVEGPGSENREGFERLEKAFAAAHIKLDIQNDMPGWLRIHAAGSIAFCAALRGSENIDAFLNDDDLLREAMIATRECLNLCRRLGARPGPEFAAFHLPLFLLLPLFRRNLRTNPSVQRYIAHGPSIPLTETKSLWQAMLTTAQEFDLPMPKLRALGRFLNEPLQSNRASNKATSYCHA